MIRDRIPDISLKLDTTPRNFIERLASIASENEHLQVKKEFGKGIEKSDFLILDPKLQIKHRGLIGQVIAPHPNNSERVRISMNAREWNPNPVTYEVYTEEALTLFNPLIKKYNKRYESRRRIYIQSKSALIPKLPPKAKVAFHYFISLINPTSIHISDWKRFYEFIRICHEGRIRLIEDDIIRLLVLEEFDEELARDFANVYYHIRKYLKRDFYVFYAYGSDYKL